jgi:hypothetical protein
MVLFNRHLFLDDPKNTFMECSIVFYIPKKQRLVIQEFGQPLRAPKTALNYNRMFRLGLFGNSACGKSCFLNRLCNDKFEFKYLQTVAVEFGAVYFDHESETRVKLQIVI